MIIREVKYSCETISGKGYKSVESFGGRKRWYVQDLDGNWYSTNNRDWEPECEIADHVKMEIV